MKPCNKVNNTDHPFGQYWEVNSETTPDGIPKFMLTLPEILKSKSFSNHIWDCTLQGQLEQ